MTLRLSEQEYEILTKRKAPAKVTKYRNVPTTVDGLRFDSKAEAAHWGELQMEERAGRINGLRRQVDFPIVVNETLVCQYRADFVYFRDGRRIVEDVKGMRTPLFALKAKLVRAVLGFDVVEVRR